MLFIHLRLGLPSGLFPSGFPTNNLYTFLKILTVKLYLRFVKHGASNTWRHLGSHLPSLNLTLDVSEKRQAPAVLSQDKRVAGKHYETE
jgi:hypothetical protein